MITIWLNVYYPTYSPATYVFVPKRECLYYVTAVSIDDQFYYADYQQDYFCSYPTHKTIHSVKFDKVLREYKSNNLLHFANEFKRAVSQNLVRLACDYLGDKSFSVHLRCHNRVGTICSINGKDCPKPSEFCAKLDPSYFGDDGRWYQYDPTS